MTPETQTETQERLTAARLAMEWHIHFHPTSGLADAIKTFLAHHDSAARSYEGMRGALEQVKAALGDRLLGKGPLAKEYAHSVMRQIDAALQGAPSAEPKRLLPEEEAVLDAARECVLAKTQWLATPSSKNRREWSVAEMRLATAALHLKPPAAPSTLPAQPDTRGGE